MQDNRVVINKEGQPGKTQSLMKITTGYRERQSNTNEESFSAEKQFNPNRHPFRRDDIESRENQPKRINYEEYKKNQVGKTLNKLFKAGSKKKKNASQTPYIDKAIEILEHYDLNKQQFEGDTGKFISIDGGYGDYTLKQHHIKFRLTHHQKINTKLIKPIFPELFPDYQ